MMSLNFLKFSLKEFTTLLDESVICDKVPKLNLNISNFLKLSAIL